MCAPVISLLGLPALGCTAQPSFSWLYILITGEASGGCSLTYLSVPGLSLRWCDCSSSGLGPQVPPGSPPGSPGVGSCTQSSVGGCLVGTDRTQLALPFDSLLFAQSPWACVSGSLGDREQRPAAPAVPAWASLPCMGRARGCLSLLGFHRLALGNPDCPPPPFHGSYSFFWIFLFFMLEYERSAAERGSCSHQ